MQRLGWPWIEIGLHESNGKVRVHVVIDAL